jgi:hypothetical protein
LRLQFRRVAELAGRKLRSPACACDRERRRERRRPRRRARIWRGEDGYSFFEIFNSTFDEPSAVNRAAIEMTLDGKSSRYTVEGVGEAVLMPLRSPVGGAENDVRILKPEGFHLKDGAIGTSERLRVELPEMNFDVSGRHTVYAEFDYAVV